MLSRDLNNKAEIERVKQANELVGFIRSRGVSLTQHVHTRLGPTLAMIYTFTREMQR